jgi:hypothetical protein
MRPHLRKNERIELLDDLYAQDVRDDVWIPEAGEQGRIILTKDAMIQRRPNEQAALLAASTAVFVFTRGGVTSERVALSMVAAMPSIREAVRRFDVPLLGRINLAGEVNVAVEAGEKLTSPKFVKRKS